jgi:capsular exopolysaccharide synthesis family protein
MHGVKAQPSLHLQRPHALAEKERLTSVVTQQGRPDRREKKRRWWRSHPFRKKYLWLAAVCLFGPALILLYTLYTAVPVYRAEATLLIGARGDQSLNSSETDVRNSRDLEEDDYKTQYELLKSRNFAGLVIREQNLDVQTLRATGTQVLEFIPDADEEQAGTSSEVSAQAIEVYLGNLEIAPVQGTRLVRIAFRAPDPQLAARVANAHAETCIRHSKEYSSAGQMRTSSLTLVDAAVPPTRPMRTQIPFSLVVSALCGILGGTGFLYYAKRVERRLLTPADVTRILGLPTLGVIPDFSSRELRTDGPMPLPAQMESLPGVFPKELLLAYHPLSLVPEAYRNLRAELLLSRSSGPPRALLMASGMSGEGKTLTVLNTSISLAQMGVRVLVIDADLRHPHCHTVLKRSKGLGLTEFLTGQQELAEVIQTTRIDRLFLLSGGAVPPNPAELLGSKKMQAALSFLGHLYDYIVIDSPPLGLVSDALILSPFVDGVVLVVNSETGNHKIAQEAQDRLVHARAKVLGVVLNKVDAGSREYADFARRYRAYYRQTNEATEETTSLEPSSFEGVSLEGTSEMKEVRKSSRKGEKRVESRLKLRRR